VMERIGCFERLFRAALVAAGAILLSSIRQAGGAASFARTSRGFGWHVPVVPTQRSPTLFDRDDVMIPSRHSLTAQGLLASPSSDVPVPLKDSRHPNYTYPQQSPHSGRHFFPSHPAYQKRRSSWWRRIRQRRRPRFMEGWYYRLTLPEDGISFAFIISIEDPGRKPPSDLRLACIQIVGPDDGYLVQADKDDAKFWAWKHVQGLGCVFSFRGSNSSSLGGSNETQLRTRTYLQPTELEQWVESGFQVVLPWTVWGRIRGHDGTLGGVLDGQGVPGSCDFDFAVEPKCGWGGKRPDQQRSTAGWLASYRVFEPHWQARKQVVLSCDSPSYLLRSHSRRFVCVPLARSPWPTAGPREVLRGRIERTPLRTPLSTYVSIRPSETME
jgi:Tocopherol cyclase